MLERDFQSQLVRKIKKIFPGCIVIKNDSTQGYPDLLILHENKWASLECKIKKGARRQPNQEYYVDKMNEMSFSRFVYPENEEEVLNELQQTFGSRRAARLSRRQ